MKSRSKTKKSLGEVNRAGLLQLPLLLSSEEHLSFSRVLLDTTKDLPTALILHDIAFWCTRPDVIERGGWTAKSNKDWQEEYYLTDYTVRKAIKWIKDNGAVSVELKKFDGTPTNHYTLNVDWYLTLLSSRKKDDKSVKPISCIQPTPSLPTTKPSVETDESLTDTIILLLSSDTDKKSKSKIFEILDGSSNIKKKYLGEVAKHTTLRDGTLFFGQWAIQLSGTFVKPPFIAVADEDEFAFKGMLASCGLDITRIKQSVPRKPRTAPVDRCEISEADMEKWG